MTRLEEIERDPTGVVARDIQEYLARTCPELTCIETSRGPLHPGSEPIHEGMGYRSYGLEARSAHDGKRVSVHLYTSKYQETSVRVLVAVGERKNTIAKYVDLASEDDVASLMRACRTLIDREMAGE